MSQKHQVLKVANLFYKNVPDLVCLLIDPSKLQNTLKYEPPAHPDGKPHDELSDSDLFPHLFGPLNLSAVIGMAELTQNEAGAYIGFNPRGEL